MAHMNGILSRMGADNRAIHIAEFLLRGADSEFVAGPDDC
jgi:hypothetical protein